MHANPCGSVSMPRKRDSLPRLAFTIFLPISTSCTLQSFSSSSFSYISCNIFLPEITSAVNSLFLACIQAASDGSPYGPFLPRSRSCSCVGIASPSIASSMILCVDVVVAKLIVAPGNILPRLPPLRSPWACRSPARSGLESEGRFLG